MVVRLSELLDRIRPAGAPGGAGDGDQHTEQLTLDEIADIVGILDGFEADADRIRAAANQQAHELRQAGEREVRRIRSDLPDRVAGARAVGASRLARQHDAELGAIAEETTRRLERLDVRAAAELPRITEAALSLLWSTVESATAGDDR